MALVYGMGVAVDEAAGVAWYRRAAAAGHAHSRLKLYTCYRDGLAGLKPDDPAAMPLLRAAAASGFAEAQAELFYCLRFGRGMAVDAVEAIVWLRRAAAGGMRARRGSWASTCCEASTCQPTPSRAWPCCAVRWMAAA